MSEAVPLHVVRMRLLRRSGDVAADRRRRDRRTPSCRCVARKLMTVSNALLLPPFQENVGRQSRWMWTVCCLHIRNARLPAPSVCLHTPSHDVSCRGSVSRFPPSWNTQAMPPPQECSSESLRVLGTFAVSEDHFTAALGAKALRRAGSSSTKEDSNRPFSGDA